MENIAADSLYDVVFAAPDGDAVQDLLTRAESELRESASDFGAAWGVSPSDAADPGPETLSPAAAALFGHAAAEPQGDTQGAGPQGGRRGRGERVVVADSRITVLPDPAEVFDPDQA